MPKIKKGDRVKVALIDPEEGIPYEAEGVVTCDWEKINYTPKVDIELDNGEFVVMVKKHTCELLCS